MLRTPAWLLLAACLSVLGTFRLAVAGDWPQWRYDAQRSAATADALPDGLRLAWVRELPKLRAAWPDQPKMQLDQAYEPVVLGQRLFVGSSHDDSVTAYDTASGEELWRFYADGPVRFAPLAWQDKLYFAADDGYLYCLAVEDGALLWRFRGGPSDRKILGNERLISTWPVRGAPVLADGTIYFAAGIWPFMGTFIHALDAETGKVLWTTDGDGSQYIKQPHNSDSFAGVAPQGPLVVSGDKLLIPGGRSVPAGYDRHSGKFLYYQLALHGKRGGGSTVAALGNLLYNGGSFFDVKDEQYLGAAGSLVAGLGDYVYAYDGDLRMLELRTQEVTLRETVDRKGEKVLEKKWGMQTVAEVDAPSLTTMIVAGSRVYAGEKGRLLAYDLPLKEDAKHVWEAKIEGTPTSLIAAADQLFAVTLEGRIYAFSATAESPRRLALAPPMTAGNASATVAKPLLQACGRPEGYGLIVGAKDSALVLELAAESKLRWVVIDADAQAVAKLRAALAGAGLGADRVAALVADPRELDLPPYFASLIVALERDEDEDAAASAALLARLYACLRPFGGTLCTALPLGAAEKLVEERPIFQTSSTQVTAADQWTLITRAGALAGSANWTHEHADAANTRVSPDTLVKAPLGLLWFGGPSNDAILPRHGHGPQPQVVDGRLFIEGLDVLRATDIYTGRLLWEVKLPGLGSFYNNTAHQPGANAAGTNYISTPEGIYVAYKTTCLQLDPVTGRKLAEFQLPAAKGEKKPPAWSYLNVAGDYLIGGSEPLVEAGFLGKITGENDNYSSSKRLTIMDRTSGEVLWTIEANNGFRHNAICIGGGRLYCIDRLSGAQLSRLKRRGESPKFPPRLAAHDLATGAEIWSTSEDVIGTWLSYSAKHDILLESGRPARDTLSDEAKGVRAYRASEGEMLWSNAKYLGPAMIHHDTILLSNNACDLLTGALKLREHPLTGELVEWIWSRNYGCNTPMASEHLLTFRSGAAGYFDFCNDGGTGNFGGFRSSCTNNLVVAGGVLCAPDYTRTCTCNYQNQTSIALVPLAEVETWTSFGAQSYKQPVRRVGINLGAPGDRKADDGTLWIDYPSIGGASPAVKIATVPKDAEDLAWFRRHSSQVSGEGLAWVSAAGAEGLRSLEITLADEKAAPRNYTVRLHFAEPQPLAAGQRVFAVRLQGKVVEEALDVASATGGSLRGLVKEYAKVRCGETLLIELTPLANSEHPAVLCGVEVLAEGW